MKKLTTQEFIDKAKAKHNSSFVYDKVNYVSSHQKVIIICPVHGEFNQTPVCHLAGNGGCPICRNEKLRTLFTTDVRKYKIKKDGFITCEHHGRVKQAFQSFRNNGCRKCYAMARNAITFISKAKQVHGEKFDYSKFNYSGVNKKSIIICPVHGEFTQKPSMHYIYGCKKCGDIIGADKKTKNTDWFIENATRLHGGMYSYNKTTYHKCDVPLIITCKYHGDFEQKPEVHLNGSGCKKCTRNGIYNLSYFGRTGTSSESFLSRRNKIVNLYFIKLYSEADIFYKVGISSGQRCFKNCTIEHINSLVGTLFNMYTLEQQLLSMVELYRPLVDIGGGQTECFKADEEMIQDINFIINSCK